ncbi:NAD(P)H-dependent glycerol-3-phosphate dehydrogenase [Pseudooceanicola nitratireducens]|uniref:NAD(P)H-dependent glycerol-3-phosphate dehydrogenase n=1 Tax=Pseudooceanicola nitratireducens TaxID=517719 RepID=UPI0023F2AD99|nr:NAD(P)H-dependent glycerol-3-phosphate dehydrogenase [Pseudooceanicola nitratireducens]
MTSVIGAGAFGTALAISLGRAGAVTLWARDADQVAAMAQARENAARLPGIAFPDALALSDDATALPDGPVLLSVPMQKLRDALRDLPDFGTRPLVACCKGIELTTGQSPTQVIAEMRPDAPAAILTGPSFAQDIARGLPTALTLACADETTGKALQQSLTTPNIRVYRTTDVPGAEIGGAVKNVMAIACGAAIGAGLGDSARAALMTRGYAEMQRMALALGAQADTLAGLSGFGDLALTCTSDLSRNFRFGLSIGRGEAFDPSVTVEGAATARALQARARKMQIDMPITDAVVGLIDGNLDVGRAMALLLSRPLKEE